MAYHVGSQYTVRPREMRNPAVPNRSAAERAVLQQDGFRGGPRICEIVHPAIDFPGMGRDGRQIRPPQNSNRFLNLRRQMPSSDEVIVSHPNVVPGLLHLLQCIFHEIRNYAAITAHSKIYIICPQFGRVSQAVFLK